MARSPLALSAHPSAWTADAEPGGRQAAIAATVTCQFCGQPTAGWQEPYHLNDDHADTSPANIVNSCPLCHLPQHLNRPEIDREAVLIWLPEMAQAALNVLVRQLHLALAAAGQPPTCKQAASAVMPAAANAPLAACRALHERAAAADMRLGTSSPRRLGAALLELPPSEYDRRAELLGGVRLLPLGRLHRNGRDSYPDMLEAWAAPAAGPHDAP